MSGAVIIAVAIILAALIIADAGQPARRGGYQPVPGGSLPKPPTGGSGVAPPPSGDD